MIFPVAFTGRAVASGAPGKAHAFVPLGPVADYFTLWICGVSVFLDEHRKGASYLFIKKKKGKRESDDRDVQGQVDSSMDIIQFFP